MDDMERNNQKFESMDEISDIIDMGLDLSAATSFEGGEYDAETGELTAIIIFGRPKFFGLIGKQEDIIIPWKDIKVIGPETVLVSSDSAKFAALLG